MQWYHAEVGSAWYLAHIVTLFFLWLALLEIFNKQRLFLIGLLIGCAYLARLPSILSVIFVLFYLQHKFISFEQKKLNLQNFILLGAGLLPAISVNAFYNYARFGVIYDISYSLLPVFNEPWYRYGLFSIRNIPIHLGEILTAMPKIMPTFPYIIPSLNVMALWFVTPALLLILLAKFKTKIAITSVITVLFISVPSLMHGSNGFTQFGYRFALDYLPFLLILTGLGMRGKVRWWSKLLILLSILINLWGVIMISFLKMTSL